MRLRLQARYTAILVALTVSVIAVLGGVLLHQFDAAENSLRRSSDEIVRGALLAQLDQQGRGTAQALADILVNPLYGWDINAATNLIDAAAGQSGVEVVRLFAEDGKPLYVSETESSAAAPPIDPAKLQQVIERRELISAIDDDRLAVLAPVTIGSQLLGVIHVSLTRAKSSQDIRALQAAMAKTRSDSWRANLLALTVVAGLLIAVTVLLSTVIARGLVRPIAALSLLTQRIGAGDYDIAIPFDRNDEVGELGEALNRMAQTLKRTTVSKGYVEDILGSMTDPLFVLTGDGRVESANNAAGIAFGCNSSALAGRPIEELIDAIPDLDAGMNSCSFESTITMPGGGPIPVLVSLVPMRKPGGADVRLLCVARDISERKRAESELRAAHEQLKDAVDKLARKERLSMLGQVAATVSHELRNPLAAIRNSVFLVRQLAAGTGATIERALGRAERNIDRCDKIIGSMLDFTRVRTLDGQPTALDRWLAEMIEEHDLPTGVTIRCELRCDRIVLLDHHGFQQVLVNLVDNASQALTTPGWTPGDGRALTIAIETRTNGPLIQMSVADNGPGIKPENMQKIFEPLFTTKSFGVGLGLPTVKQIVEQHGGTIDVDSSPDRGTKFTISLPVLGEGASAGREASAA